MRVRAVHEWLCEVAGLGFPGNAAPPPVKCADTAAADGTAGWFHHLSALDKQKQSHNPPAP